MKKAIICLFLLFILIGTLALVHTSRYDSETNVSGAYSDCPLMQLRDIVLSLDCQPPRQFIDKNETTTHLFRLMDLFSKARYIQNALRGTPDECTYVITGFGYRAASGIYVIGFAYEKYIELIDFISDFTGIPDDMICYEIVGVISFDPSFGQPINDAQTDAVVDEGFSANQRKALNQHRLLYEGFARARE